jgi:hypothetical protein
MAVQAMTKLIRAVREADAHAEKRGLICIGSPPWATMKTKKRRSGRWTPTNWLPRQLG